MLIKRLVVVRAIASALVFVLSFSELAQASLVDGAGTGYRIPLESGRTLEDPALLEVPAEFCKVREIHASPVPGAPFLIHIQDAHSNFSAQENLAKTLDHLLRHYPIRDVLVEGGFGDETLDFIKPLTEKKNRDRAARRFLIEGKMAGEEYLNLTSDHKMKILGIEDPALYERCLKAYAKLSTHRPKALEYLTLIRRCLRKAKERLYPAEFLRYEGNGKTPKAGGESGEEDESLESLFDLADFKDFSLEGYPNLIKVKALKQKENAIDFQAVNLEYRLMAGSRPAPKTGDLRGGVRAPELDLPENLDSKKFPALAQYQNYQREFKALDLEDMLKEKDALEESVYRTGLNNVRSSNTRVSDAYRLRLMDRYLGLLEKAYSVRLTSEEFARLRAVETDLEMPAALAFLNRKLTELGFYEDLIPESGVLSAARKDLFEFYALVQERDGIFIQKARNYLKQQEAPSTKSPLDAASSEPIRPQAAVLIAGGYHTAHLTELFRREEWSYVVLTPTVTGPTDTQKYESILLESLHTPKREVVTTSQIRADALRSSKSTRLPEFLTLAAARLADGQGANRRGLAEQSEALSRKKAIPRGSAARLAEQDVPVTTPSGDNLERYITTIAQIAEDLDLDEKNALSLGEYRSRGLFMRVGWKGEGWKSDELRENMKAARFYLMGGKSGDYLGEDGVGAYAALNDALLPESPKERIAYLTTASEKLGKAIEFLEKIELWLRGEESQAVRKSKFVPERTSSSYKKDVQALQEIQAQLKTWADSLARTVEGASASSSDRIRSMSGARLAAEREDIAFLNNLAAEISLPEASRGWIENILRRSFEGRQYSHKSIALLAWLLADNRTSKLPPFLSAAELLQAIDSFAGVEGLCDLIELAHFHDRGAMLASFPNLIYAMQLQNEGYEVKAFERRYEPNKKVPIVLKNVRTGEDILVATRYYMGRSESNEMEDWLDKWLRPALAGFEKIIHVAENDEEAQRIQRPVWLILPLSFSEGGVEKDLSPDQAAQTLLGRIIDKGESKYRSTKTTGIPHARVLSTSFSGDLQEAERTSTFLYIVSEAGLAILKNHMKGSKGAPTITRIPVKSDIGDRFLAKKTAIIGRELALLQAAYTRKRLSLNEANQCLNQDHDDPQTGNIAGNIKQLLLLNGSNHYLVQAWLFKQMRRVATSSYQRMWAKFVIGEWLYSSNLTGKTLNDCESDIDRMAVEIRQLGKPGKDAFLLWDKMPVGDIATVSEIDRFVGELSSAMDFYFPDRDEARAVFDPSGQAAEQRRLVGYFGAYLYKYLLIDEIFTIYSNGKRVSFTPKTQKLIDEMQMPAVRSNIFSGERDKWFKIYFEYMQRYQQSPMLQEGFGELLIGIVGFSGLQGNSWTYLRSMLGPLFESKLIASERNTYVRSDGVENRPIEVATESPITSSLFAMVEKFIPQADDGLKDLRDYLKITGTDRDRATDIESVAILGDAIVGIGTLFEILSQKKQSGRYVSRKEVDCLMASIVKEDTQAEVLKACLGPTLISGGPRYMSTLFEAMTAYVYQKNGGGLRGIDAATKFFFSLILKARQSDQARQKNGVFSQEDVRRWIDRLPDDFDVPLPYFMSDKGSAGVVPSAARLAHSSPERSENYLLLEPTAARLAPRGPSGGPAEAAGSTTIPFMPAPASRREDAPSLTVGLSSGTRHFSSAFERASIAFQDALSRKFPRLREVFRAASLSRAAPAGARLAEDIQKKVIREMKTIVDGKYASLIQEKDLPDGLLKREHRNGKPVAINLVGQTDKFSVYVDPTDPTCVYKVCLPFSKAKFGIEAHSFLAGEINVLGTLHDKNPDIESAHRIGKILDAGVTKKGVAWVRLESWKSAFDLDSIKGKEMWSELPDQQKIKLLGDLADTYASIHTAGVLHNDIKPKNILINKNGNGSYHLTVIDFDVAILMGTDGHPIYLSHNVTAFTPDFYSLDEERSFQSDVRALGLVIKILIPEYKELNEDLSSLVSHMMDEKPENRPASMGIVRESLRKISESLFSDKSAARLSKSLVQMPDSSAMVLAERQKETNAYESRTDAIVDEVRETLNRAGVDWRSVARLVYPASAFDVDTVVSLLKVFPKIQSVILIDNNSGRLNAENWDKSVREQAMKRGIDASSIKITPMTRDILNLNTDDIKPLDDENHTLVVEKAPGDNGDLRVNPNFKQAILNFSRPGDLVACLPWVLGRVSNLRWNKDPIARSISLPFLNASERRWIISKLTANDFPNERRAIFGTPQSDEPAPALPSAARLASPANVNAASGSPVAAWTGTAEHPVDPEKVCEVVLNVLKSANFAGPIYYLGSGMSLNADEFQHPKVPAVALRFALRDEDISADQTKAQNLDEAIKAALDNEFKSDISMAIAPASMLRDEFRNWMKDGRTIYWIKSGVSGFKRYDARSLRSALKDHRWIVPDLEIPNGNSAAEKAVETQFFRPWSQLGDWHPSFVPRYDQFIDRMLKLAKEKKYGDSPVKILVPGCSSGEEVYTIAMELAHLGAPLWSFEVVGIDDKQTLIDKARKGVYAEAAKEQIASQKVAIFERWTKLTLDGGYEIDSALKERCKFVSGDISDSKTFASIRNVAGIAFNYTLKNIPSDQRLQVLHNLASASNLSAVMIYRSGFTPPSPGAYVEALFEFNPSSPTHFTATSDPIPVPTVRMSTNPKQIQSANARPAAVGPSVLPSVQPADESDRSSGARLASIFGRRPLSGETRNIMKIISPALNSQQDAAHQPIRFIDLGAGDGSFGRMFEGFLRNNKYSNVEGVNVDSAGEPIHDGKFIISKIEKLLETRPDLTGQFPIVFFNAPQIVDSTVRVGNRIHFNSNDVAKFVSTAKSLLAPDGVIIVRLYHKDFNLDSLDEDEYEDARMKTMLEESRLLFESLSGDPEIEFAEYSIGEFPDLPEGKDPLGGVIVIRKKTQSSAQFAASSGARLTSARPVSRGEGLNPPRKFVALTPDFRANPSTSGARLAEDFAAPSAARLTSVQSVSRGAGKNHLRALAASLSKSDTFYHQFRAGGDWAWARLNIQKHSDGSATAIFSQAEPLSADAVEWSEFARIELSAREVALGLRSLRRHADSRRSRRLANQILESEATGLLRDENGSLAAIRQFSAKISLAEAPVAHFVDLDVFLGPELGLARTQFSEILKRRQKAGNAPREFYVFMSGGEVVSAEGFVSDDISALRLDPSSARFVYHGPNDERATQRVERLREEFGVSRIGFAPVERASLAVSGQGVYRNLPGEMAFAAFIQRLEANREDLASLSTQIILLYEQVTGQPLATNQVTRESISALQDYSSKERARIIYRTFAYRPRPIAEEIMAFYLSMRQAEVMA